MSLSIIIPTFNRLWSLTEAIASCPRDPRIEIIVIDDGSNDGTAEWLSEQSGITVITQTNTGKSRAVNGAMASARGDYIRFLDSDDILITGQVIPQLEFAQASNADVCVAGYREWFSQGDRYIEHPWDDCGDFLAQQLGECDSSHYSAYIFRRSFIAGLEHRTEYAIMDDRAFVVDCAMEQPRVSTWPEPTLIHRQHNNARIQFQPGSMHTIADWQELQMWKRIINQLDAKALNTPRRLVAVTNNLWPLAVRIGARFPGEGREVFHLIQQLVPEFVPPCDSAAGKVFRLVGIKATMHIARCARLLRNFVRRLAFFSRR
ncbi:MAG: glycosyltransferase family 2 protein [Novosphingobium sp.]